MKTNYIAGVELGGTKTVLSLGAGRNIVEQIRFPTSDSSSTLENARSYLATWVEKYPVKSLGIASFGPLQVDPAKPDFGTMLPTPKRGWTGADIAGSLTADLALPYQIDTDVNGAALAEYLWGAAKRERALCYITIGTGLGGGFVIDGNLVHGAMHPEIGHIRVRRGSNDGFPGVCPFHGDCIEGLVAGPALAARFGASIVDIRDDDPRWDGVARDLAELISIVLLTTAASRILLGGTVALKRSFLLEKVRCHLIDQVAGYLPFLTTETVSSIVTLAGLRDMAGPMGSLALATAALPSSSQQQ